MLSEGQQQWLRDHSNKKEGLDLTSIVAGKPPAPPHLSMQDIVLSREPASSPVNDVASTASVESHETGEGSDLGFC